jgi:hypothetical protein
MVNCRLIFDVLQYDVNQTLVNEIKYNYNTYDVSSGSIVSDNGLDYRAIGVRSPAGAKDVSSNLCVQTGSEAHPASCTMGTGDKSAAGA